MQVVREASWVWLHRPFWSVSGASGSGKTTLIQRLLATETTPRRKPLLRITTRLPRPTDIGNEYEYVGEELFRIWRAQGLFLWWFSLHGNLYGAPRTVIDAALGNEAVIADLSVDSVKSLYHYAANIGRVDKILSIYLHADESVLRRRLMMRGERDIERRLDECRDWFHKMQRSPVPYHFIDASQPPEIVFREALGYFMTT